MLFNKQQHRRKTAKSTYKCVIKRKLKNCLEATELRIKLNRLEKNKNNIDSLREKPKELIKKNNKLIPKSQ